jgi:hypothetical protein
VVVGRTLSEDEKAFRAVVFVVVIYLLTALLCVHASAATIPDGAQRLAPVLTAQMRATWPAAPKPWTVAGQIEQESCITLTHSKCWSERAELNTVRENGFGLGQFTTAYTVKGGIRTGVRFNKFLELKTQYPKELAGWTWEGRFDAAMQLRAIVLMDLDLWRKVAADGPGADVDEHWAFTLAGYNGGLGGVRNDRLLCANTPGCNPSRWFGHVARQSLSKSKTPQAAYGGKSFFTISREYPDNIENRRRDKYRVFWSDDDV